MENNTTIADKASSPQVVAQFTALEQTIESLTERLNNVEQGCVALNDNYNGHIKELHINKSI